MHGLLKDIIPLEPVNLLNNQNDNFALKYINDKTHYKKINVGFKISIFPTRKLLRI